MIRLAHARKSDIALHLMSKDTVSQPHLIEISYSSQDIKRDIVASLIELAETNPAVSVAEFNDSCHVSVIECNDCCHITVNAAYELPIVAEIIADYWSSYGFIVTRYNGDHSRPNEVETFLTRSMKQHYAQGKYTYPYGTANPDTESESES